MGFAAVQYEGVGMPLSEPVGRELLHQRDIVLHGFRRDDGQFDVEAQLTDTKSYGFPSDDRGYIAQGEPLHGMSMRMTVDAELLITAFEASTDYSPYAICPTAAENFGRLVGIRIGRGFLKAAAERVGGTHGCTHLRELLQQMATVAIQTLYSKRQKSDRGADSPKGLLNTCYAYSTNGLLVQKRWPEHYTGAAVSAEG